jgi:hypothetical protein
MVLPSYLQTMSKVYNSAIGAIKAAMLEAGAGEEDMDRLYFHETLIVSIEGIGVRFTIIFVDDDGRIETGDANYFG